VELFEGNQGFGFEEWLFNPRHRRDGWRYGYLQAFQGQAHVGAQYSQLSLITRWCYKKYRLPGCMAGEEQYVDGWYFVADLQEAVCLGDEEADEILHIGEEMGWVDSMRGQLGAGQLAVFEEHEEWGGRYIFNVKFKAVNPSIPRLCKLHGAFQSRRDGKRFRIYTR
jgi:hypothetical protein